MTYRRKDAYYRRARATGYRARSAYKLAQLDDRFHLLRRGDHVLDLGAWPGGWLQVARERVGTEGRIVGIDVETVARLPASNVFLITGDVRDPAAIRAAVDRLGRAADVVLSDLAPKLTGIRETDAARMTELADAARHALPVSLRPGGQFLMKTFMTPGHDELVGELRRVFGDVHTTRPEATRHGSSELYVVGRGYDPGRS